LDTNFDPGPIANVAFYSRSNPVVYAIALQPDGKVLMGGGFTNINGTGRNNIARLNADGSVDASFDPGSGTDSSVYNLALQPDGKVLIAGGFLSVNGVSRNYFARLNQDGSLDYGFNPNVTNAYSSTIVVQPDGRILVGGYELVNDFPQYVVWRLLADGSLDTSFSAGGAASGLISPLAVQPDGKIIVSALALPHLVRLNSDGSPDADFNPGTGPNVEVNTVALQPDGKIVIGGLFTNISGDARNHIARLNTDGSVDTGFNASPGPDDDIRSIALQPQSRIVIGGVFSSVNGVPRARIARLLGNPPPVARITVSPLAQFPGIANLFVISPNSSNAVVFLDGSASSSSDDEALQYRWSEGSTALATTAATTNRFVVGWHTFTLQVTDSGGSDTTNVTLDIIAPPQAVSMLAEWLESASLNKQIQRPLLGTLRAAASSFEHGNLRAGTSQLEAFQQKVQVQVAGQNPALAQELIKWAGVILDALKEQ
jgi:uncharacterized delta-60 repeat protein